MIAVKKSKIVSSSTVNVLGVNLKVICDKEYFRISDFARVMFPQKFGSEKASIQSSIVSKYINEKFASSVVFVRTGEAWGKYLCCDRCDEVNRLINDPVFLKMVTSSSGAVIGSIIKKNKVTPEFDFKEKPALVKAQAVLKPHLVEKTILSERTEDEKIDKLIELSTNMMRINATLLERVSHLTSTIDFNQKSIDSLVGEIRKGQKPNRIQIYFQSAIEKFIFFRQSLMTVLHDSRQ